MKKDIDQRILSITPHLKVRELLQGHTTMHVGGPALYYVEAHTRQQVAGLYELSLREKIPFMILGNGSNIVFGDKGFPGMIVRFMGELASYTFENDTVVAGAGVRLGALVNDCCERGLSGLEGLTGIPGTIGGALVSNAGTFVGWIEHSVESVDILSAAGKIVTLHRKDMHFSYRHSDLDGKVILGGRFCLKKGIKNDIVSKINDIMQRRTNGQPLGTWNSGSVFKNPPGDTSWRLIDACKLRGVSCGGAIVSEKHANFIVNTGTASAADIRSLIAMIRSTVKDRFGIELELEIKLIGD